MPIKESKAKAKDEYSKLMPSKKQTLEALAIAEIAKFPRMKEITKDVVRKDNSISYHGISIKIGLWCSASTIQGWISSREGCRLYSEKTLPLSFLQQLGTWLWKTSSCSL